jgi:hypothetical protein
MGYYFKKLFINGQIVFISKHNQEDFLGIFQGLTSKRLILFAL